MTTPTITVSIDADGSLTVSVSGLKGSGCRALTEGIERALGGKADTRETAEYREQPESQQARQGRGGAA